MLSKKEILFYKTNGYIIKRKFVSNVNRKKFLTTFIKILKKYSILSISNLKNWENKDLNKKLINLRKKNPKQFSRIYDIIQKTVSIKKILIKEKLVNLACRVLSESEDTICEINTILRMDPPNDVKNSLDWHQDGSLNKSKNNQSCVLWCPMTKVDKNNGAVELLIKSHKIKGVPKAKFKNFVIKKYQSFIPELDAGDVLIINNKTIHKSGHNSSDKIRFTLRSRFNKLP